MVNLSILSANIRKFCEYQKLQYKDNYNPEEQYRKLRLFLLYEYMYYILYRLDGYSI